MNVKRGLFRLWLVFSLAFIVGVIWYFEPELNAQVDVRGTTVYYVPNGDRQAATGSVINVPVECANARGEKGIDYLSDLTANAKSALCWYQLPRFRSLFTEYKDLDDKEVADRLYEKAGVVSVTVSTELRPSPWFSILRVTAIAFGVPIAVLVLGSALLWVATGFKREH